MSINRRQIEEDIAHLKTEFGYYLANVEMPGFNDVIVLHYQNENKPDIKICRNKGFYEVIVKSDDCFRNIFDGYQETYENKEEYHGKPGHERLINDLRIYLDKI